MKRLLAIVCLVRGHKRIALTINGRYSGKEWCDRCGRDWWRGQ